MNDEKKGFWLIRDYALRSPLARHYLFLFFVLLANVMFLWGPEIAQFLGEKPSSPSGSNRGDGIFQFWCIFTFAISGYLFSRMKLTSGSGGNLTPVVPGLLWLVAGCLTMWVLHDNLDLVRDFAQQEIAKTVRDYGSEPLFSLPAGALMFITGSQLTALILFSLLDIRAAFDRKPVIMNLPEELPEEEAEPERELKPVSPPAPQATLATRDTLALQPRLTFDDLAGMEELKDKLHHAALEWKNGGRMNGKNGIFLYGEPGTGKTAFAEALAGELKLRIMKVNIGSMASRWINQTTEQFQDIIDSALRQAPCVLFLDEVEAVLPDRSRIERGDSEEAKVVASFLSSVDKLRYGRVLLIAATNYKDRVDEASIRTGRFDFRIEVALPDFEARKGLILRALKETGKTVEPAVLDRLSRRWAGFNVPRVQEATLRAARFAATNTVEMRDFMRGLRDVQGNKTGVPESAPGLADLYFDDGLKERLSNLAATFTRSDEIEALGGNTEKRNVIFYGPPGTGKTTMAQALAKEAGWTFIATSGKEIAMDANRLVEIRRKASDLRPAIVFIDEADDILGDRNYSGMKLHTNDLLRIIDGAGEPLPDVVWILATNNIDGLDEAVTRRFPTKIELPAPSLATLTRLVRDWAARRPEMIPGGVDAWSQEVAAALEGLTPSVVRGILDSALNTEAADSVLRGEPMRITLEEVLQARREMRV